MPAGEEEVERARRGTGMERPEELPPRGGPTSVERTFAFIDLAGFTAFTDTRGVRSAVEMLAGFRLEVSEVTARRGVRIAKWLGDGAMIVGVEAGPTVATVAEMLGRFDLTDLHVRAGMATGPVILFNGDDYIGRPVNVAARLCDAARAHQILATAEVADAAPDWVNVRTVPPIELRGIGRVDDVKQMMLAADVDLPVHDVLLNANEAVTPTTVLSETR